MMLIGNHGRSLLIGVAGLILVFVLGKFVAGKGWQRWSFDERWCKAQTLRAQPVLDALDAHRKSAGHYPETLDELVPTGIKLPGPIPYPTGNGGKNWLYRQLSPDEYELSVTALHWVSSFDALIYRSSGQYPSSWEDSHHVFRVNSWIYVIGAQKLKD